jgi:hypothetical protein
MVVRYGAFPPDFFAAAGGNIRWRLGTIPRWMPFLYKLRVLGGKGR